MRIAVLGTGVVGQTLAGKLAEMGHEVVMGTRDPGRARERSEPGQGARPLRDWLAAHPKVRLATFAEAAAHGELVVNATAGTASLEALRQAGAAGLDGKVLLDAANPLDFSRGMPPTLTVKDTDSLAEQIQREFPRARVVKAFNTMNASLMTDPGRVARGEHSAFVCGNDAAAKARVVELMRSIGWRDIIDLGDLTAARGMEMILPLWLRLMSTFQSPAFNFRIVR